MLRNFLEDLAMLMRLMRVLAGLTFLAVLSGHAGAQNTAMREAYGDIRKVSAESKKGYKFVLAGCTPTEKGIVARYQITAVPIARGLTGVRAFCADESGTLFHEENGSATQCLSSRLPV